MRVLQFVGAAFQAGVPAVQGRRLDGVADLLSGTAVTGQYSCIERTAVISATAARLVKILLVRRAPAPVRHFARGAVQHQAVQQPDDPGVGCVHRQKRMQKQARILAIAAFAEATLAGLVGWEMQLGGVLDRQHVPPGGRQHLVRGHRRVGQEAAKLARLIGSFANR